MRLIKRQFEQETKTGEADADADALDEEEGPVVEVEFGSFNVTIHQPELWG